MNESSTLPLRIERAGEVGPTLILLHGFAAANITWRRWIPILEKHYQLHIVELKGHGQAPAPDDGQYRPRDHAEHVFEYIRSVDAEEVILIGHSMGGGIAMLVALRMLEEDPGQLRGMVSLAGAAYPQPLPPFIAMARKQTLTGLFFWLLPKRPLIRAILRQIVVDPTVIDREQVEAYARPLMNHATWKAIIETALYLVPPDMEALTRRFPEITVPVLALWGEQDRVVPLSVGQRIAAELPNARLVTLKNCGHIPTEEKPEESVQAVLTFLSECERT